MYVSRILPIFAQTHDHCPMKRFIFLFITCHLLLSTARLWAEETKQFHSLMEQAEIALYTDPKLSSALASRAIALCPEKKPDRLRAEAILLYCRAEQLLGHFDLSIQNLHNVQSYIAPSEKKLNAHRLSLMGRVYGKLGDYNKAIELNDEAISYFKATGDSAALAECYNERGVTHHFMNEFQVAERFFLQALDINRSQRNLQGIAANLNNLCLYKGNTEEKLRFIQEAITINKNLNAKWSLGENYNNMGKQLYYGGNYQQALDALKTAYDYATEIGARELICDNYEYSARVYASIGDYAKAYTNLQQMYALSKELQSSNRLRNIEQEIAYKQYQEQKYAAEQQKQAYKIELLNRNLWILAILFVLGLACSFYVYKLSKRRKDLELVEARYQLQCSERELDELKLHQQQLELQNVQSALENSRQEATTFAVFLQSRNELLDKIREMIKEGYKMDAANLVPHLKKVNAYISQYQSGDNANNTLLQNIEEKNQAFVQRLTDRHPDLTQGEIHLATLLRVNLSTKEIAMITGTTPKTINMNRYRLRKALALEGEEDLVEYLTRF